MARRFTAAARTCVRAADWEARRHGDHRIGSDHLLLGLLDRPGSLAGEVLGVDLAAAREAVDDLDVAALHAVGVAVPDGLELPAIRPTKGHLTLSAGARGVLARSVARAAAERARAIEERHLLLVLLEGSAPDPACALLDAMGVDRAAARAQLRAAA